MAVIPLDELPELTHQFDGLDTFIVGGWVRDKLRPDAEPSDVDLMVAGVSKEEMLDRKFEEIDSPNNDTFGVFQDAFGREVALAREESSTGEGHTAFSIEPVDPSVDSREALRRDLVRRDFTVNAMAYSFDGVLFDPHGGVSDLKDGVLRAVDTSAFAQDPLRILRAARFAARLDAEIESETLGLMSEMVDSLEHLPQERIRKEMEKALVQSDEPSRFFDILNAVGALDATFPELGVLRGRPAGPEEFHLEGSAFRHTMMVLDEMAEIRAEDELALLMALAHDLGKAKTKRQDLPNHPAHGRDGLDVVDEMAARLSMSNLQQKVMRDASRFHMQLNNIENLRESTVINLVEEAHDPARLVSLAQADARGRSPTGSFNAANAFRRFAKAEAAIERWSGQDLIDEGYDPEEMGGENFGNLLHQKRVELMRKLEKV